MSGEGPCSGTDCLQARHCGSRLLHACWDPVMETTGKGLEGLSDLLILDKAGNLSPGCAPWCWPGCGQLACSVAAVFFHYFWFLSCFTKEVIWEERQEG